MRGKDLNRHLDKEDTQTANMHMKRCSTLQVTRELQVNADGRPSHTNQNSQTP